MKRLATILLSLALPVAGQSISGELRLSVTDPAGLGVKAVVRLISEADHSARALSTGLEGRLDVPRLPFGAYRVEITQPGFASFSGEVEIRSSVLVELPVRLTLAVVSQSVQARSADPGRDSGQAGAVEHIEPEDIQNRIAPVPGRDLQELVNSQPGWLFEGSAVLHPRGSEYQTQFVVDGIPLTDNRSPGFAPGFDAEEVQSMSLYTAGIPAEFGRKMGGIVAVNTLADPRSGLHGKAGIDGGSFGSAGAFAEGQATRGRSTLGLSASGSRTGRYLDPVVVENYTNSGSLGDFSTRYQGDLTPKDKLRLQVRHGLARYGIPNEQLQQANGQKQNADNIETLGIGSYEHIFNSQGVADLRAMARENASGLKSNLLSTPIEVFQNNSFREGYVAGSVTIDRGRHELKAGGESDNTSLHERLHYFITDPSRFDSAVPRTFSFRGDRPDLEQSAYAQDFIRLERWTINAGLRWDHYQLLLNRQAVEPRFAIARSIPSANLNLHFSYDRAFQTPSSENLLLSNSSAVESLDPGRFLRLPVEPSRGDYYEVGWTEGPGGKLKLDGNAFRRSVSNYADDNQIANTTVSFPIAFKKAVVYGAEGKLEMAAWRGFSGFASYSYAVGKAWLPVTGGLFLGEDASSAAKQLSGHFPDSQDQRNTARGMVRYRVLARFWIAGGLQFDSGLPFQFTGDPSTVAAEYGRQVLGRINFSRGRIDPALLLNGSAGADLHQSEHLKVHLQVSGQNLGDVVDVVNFGGLFSGNAIGPSRSVAVRLVSSF